MSHHAWLMIIAVPRCGTCRLAGLESRHSAPGQQHQAKSKSILVASRHLASPPIPLPHTLRTSLRPRRVIHRRLLVRQHLPLPLRPAHSLRLHTVRTSFGPLPTARLSDGHVVAWGPLGRTSQRGRGWWCRCFCGLGGGRRVVLGYFAAVAGFATLQVGVS